VRGLAERLKDQAEFLSVDIKSAAGQELVERHGLHPFQLAVFDARGQFLAATNGHSEAAVRAALDRLTG